MADRTTNRDVIEVAMGLEWALKAGAGKHLRIAQIIWAAVGGDPFSVENADLARMLREYGQRLEAEARAAKEASDGR